MEGERGERYTETVHLFLEVYRHLRTCSRRMNQDGISGRKVATLRYLHEAEPLTVGQIRDYLHVSDSSASETIARLEEKGYVERTRSRVDNRVVLVTLTPAGREIAERVPLSGMPLLRERLKELPPRRMNVIAEAMVEIARLLEIDDVC
ncbi:MAG: MarR family transcriptional regulator [Anaerolineae bacterium]|nr:MarR family transcriptional regulator [Anaerolineae bacterium]